MISAEIIADSLNEFGNRITTFIVTFPRIVLAEFNTHRMFSRNSASSRAIPFSKMVEAVQANPFIPLKWMKDHKGMQGTEYFTDPTEIENEIADWLDDRDRAIEKAIARSKRGVTKQIVNRPLETWMWHKAIVTATEYDNFFALRAADGAEIHICKLAEEMLYAMNESQPRQLRAGEWHIPFGEEIESILPPTIPIGPGLTLAEGLWIQKVKIATARCAQVSYTVLGEDGKAMDYNKLLALHDRLANAGHWSPFEHCAQAMTYDEYHSSYCGELVECEVENTIIQTPPMFDKKGSFGWSGNFRGFIQYRKTFENENRTDARLFKGA